MKPQCRIVPIGQLVLDEQNANKGTKRGRESLEQSLRNYGAGRSVLVDNKNRVIAGNKTVETARAAEMKNKTLVAVQRSDLDLKTHSKARENGDRGQSRGADRH